MRRTCWSQTPRKRSRTWAARRESAAGPGSSESPARSARRAPRKRSYAALERWRPGKVHRSVKSYNNHTGVPLSLARMPRDSELAMLEMGMNNRGRDRGADPAGAAARSNDHRNRSGAYRDSGIRGGDRRRQGRDIRGARARRDRDHPQRHSSSRPARTGPRKYADRIVTFGPGDATCTRFTRSGPTRAVA
jgi:UDP-N-acetylmuramoyl-tripeptide--D-alanyl-D-alanine ligase